MNVRRRGFHILDYGCAEGDAVPILRAFGYEKVINMAYSGDLYETDLNWEWDPATLDIVAQQ